MRNRYKEISIHKHNSSKQNFLLLYNGKFYETSTSTIELLEFLQQHDEESKGIQAYVEYYKGKYSYAYVHEVIKRVFNPLFTQNQLNNQRTFLYQREILSDKSIDKFAHALDFLFQKHFSYFILMFTWILNFIFFIRIKDLFYYDFSLNFYVLIGMYVFLLLSSFFHEIGHATACNHFGIKHGGIGIGLYLNIPVLYTNVTDIWLLQKKQRCIVNLAGIYFQTFILMFLLITYFYFHNDLLKYLILLQNINFAITLNPLFKFDGYWLLTDITGITNLKQHSSELLAFVYKKAIRQPINFTPYLFSISKNKRIILISYTILVNLFLGFYIFYLIPLFFMHLIHTLPILLEQLIFDLSKGYTIDFNIIQQLFSQLLFFSLTLYFLYRTIQPLFKWKKR